MPLPDHTAPAESRGKLQLKTLEFFLADTCNLRCRHCAASSPFLSKANLPDLNEFAESISILSRVMRCHQLKMLGGEPLLNKQICAFMRAARESGMFEQIRVTTNGLLLPAMSDAFWELADVVEISLYPAAAGTLTQEKLRSLRALANRFGARMEISPINEFFPATTDTPNPDPNLVQQIFSACLEAHDWSCHTLYRRRLYRCSRVHTLDRYLDELHVPHANFTAEDGLLIDERESLRDEARQYLASAAPLKACSFCLGTSAMSEPHSQLTIEEIRATKSGAVRPPEPLARITRIHE